jgi:hypothetical protein
MFNFIFPSLLAKSNRYDDTPSSRYKDTASSPQCLVNELTGKVGLCTQVTGNPTYQDLAAWSGDKFRVADHPERGRTSQHKRVCRY